MTEAVYTENGKIQDIGVKEELENKYPHIEQRMDLKGSVMFPGFTDSHLHMIALGETMLQLDLSEFTDANAMKQALVDKAKTLKEGQWLIGEGWNENNFADRKIFHKAELDEIAPHNPIILTRICRHAALANSPALEKAGISKRTPNPAGGIIVRDNNGEETGYLLDQAADLVKAVQPPVSDEELRQALNSAVEHMVKKGLTGGHTEDLNYYGGFQRTFRAFQDVIKEKRWKFRANLLVHHEVVDDMRQLGYEYGAVDDFLSFGAVKIFADGALGGRTALLRYPYNDAPETSGVAIHSRENLKKLVEKARKEKMPVAIHTIGDLALEYAVESLEEHPVPRGKKDRIIHAQITPPDLIDRLKKLDVVLDLQPRFVLSDFPWVKERLGTTRLSHSFAWKTLLKKGVECAGSSDAPIEPVDPLEGIQAAITRKKPAETHSGYLPEQKLTPFEAVSLYTTGSAKAIGKEMEMGKIAPGYTADFTILDQDILTINEDEMVHANVKGTVVAEEFQYNDLNI
ncbi:amidohydrolase [Alteribacillus sp. JSM 102045]|uniref:amidohydrolase n=1 Tax=Alteribacillus sp. JSM 102045 TaxID=1562101 RepID=UPI0035C18934